MKEKVLNKSKIYTRPNKDEYYLSIAKAVSERSTCYRFKCGAIIVNPNDDIVGNGYNGSAKGQENCIELGYCPFEKATGELADGSQRNCLGVHAEINAMLRASHSEMLGSTMYIYCKDRETNQEIPANVSDVDSLMIRNSGLSRIVTGRDSVVSQ